MPTQGTFTLHQTREDAERVVRELGPTYVTRIAPIGLAWLLLAEELC